MPKAGVKRALRNTDDILYILTGKRLKHVAGRVVNTFGEDMAKKVTNFFAGPEEEELPPDSPYYILGVHPDAMDIVVKAAYRALVRQTHPDAGGKSEEFIKVQKAYDAIMEERRAKAAAKNTTH